MYSLNASVSGVSRLNWKHDVSRSRGVLPKRLTAYPFVRLGLGVRFVRGSSMVHDERELRVEPVSYLVGLLGVIGHCSRWETFRERRCATLGRLRQGNINGGWAVVVVVDHEGSTLISEAGRGRHVIHSLCYQISNFVLTEPVD